MFRAGRGSGVVLSAMLVCFLVVLHGAGVAHACKTYVVGGANGWTFNTVNWPQGKKFRAGDKLVFKYNRGEHNVVTVNKDGYNGCTITPGNAKVYESGNNLIKLVKGMNHFICGIPGHCQYGMKIAIKTAA